MSKEFFAELLATGFVHTPLPSHPECSLEATLLQKPVLQQKMLFANGEPFIFTHDGSGSISRAVGMGKNGFDALKMTAPLRMDKMPEHDYFGRFSNFGTVYAHFPIDGIDFTAYNRFSCDIKTDAPGENTVHIIIGIKNDGAVKIPDRYHREGYHVANLRGMEYNHIVWEIPDLPRDKVTDIVFYAFLSGENGVNGKQVSYYIDNLAFERIERCEHSIGWCPSYETVLYPTCGYSLPFDKTAISTVAADSFAVWDAISGKKVFEGIPKPLNNAFGSFYLLDFTPIDIDSNYYITTGTFKTDVFPIGHVLLEDILWKSVSYWFCKRCGYPVPQNHGSCHHDVIAEHDGKQIVYNGGWHDSATCSKVTTQANEITYAFLAAAENAPIKGTMFYHRMYEEAQWGVDFATRVRFGDGYRVIKGTSMRYTDNTIGTFDDLDCEVHNHPLDNFLSAFTLAYAATVLKEYDAPRAYDVLQKAKEDFSFAMAEYQKTGFTKTPLPGDHTVNTAESTFDAIASCAASRLYAATREEYYAKQAVFFAKELLEFQELGEANLPLSGFFYREKQHIYPVHFNHQAREHYFMLALTLLCRTQPQHKDKALFEHSMQLYATYLKKLSTYTAPYAMLPAGVYNIAEAEDEALFAISHPGAKYIDEKESFHEQLQNGIRLSDRFVLKIFPVWFSFKGNTAVHLESGIAASLLGNYFADHALKQLAIEQIYFILGKNPFHQSLMYGMGKRYPGQYAIASGELCGEIPVGMQNYGNTDIPYFPCANNCTYKEIWSAPSRSLMLLCADLLQE